MYTDQGTDVDAIWAHALALGAFPALEDERLRLMSAGFTLDQIARLVAYRGATGAGLFSDFPPSAPVAC